MDDRVNDNDEGQDVESDTSLWSDLRGVGKTILPYVAMAAAGASVIGVATMFRKKREQKPRIDTALDRFKHLNVNIGEAACLQLVIRYACISPDWHIQYLEKADQLTKLYGHFHLLVNSCESIMNEATEAADYDSGTGVSNDDLKEWRRQAYRSKYLVAVWLSDAIVIRQTLVSLAPQLAQLVRAWKTYWGAVGDIFLAPVKFSERHPEKNEHATTMLNMKLKYVVELRKTGLDSILKIGASAPSNLHHAGSSRSPSLYDTGSANTIVTVHVGWWVRMHTTFLPQMAHVAKHLGWLPSGPDFEREASSLSLPNANNSNAKMTPKRTKIQGAKPIPSAKSSVVQQLAVWQSRVRKDGVLNVVSDPWGGFQPSEWEETFIPTCDIDPKAVHDALTNLQKKYDDNIRFMMECAGFVNDAFDQVILATGKIGMTSPTLMSPEELDQYFEKHAAIASESSQRIKVFETIWKRFIT